MQALQLGRRCEYCGKPHGVTKFRVGRDVRAVMHPKCFLKWRKEKHIPK